GNGPIVVYSFLFTKRRRYQRNSGDSRPFDGSVALHGDATSPPDDPADIWRPSASVTTRAFALFEPSFAIAPSTVTSSPILNESVFQPSCPSTLGLASPNVHSVSF